eukprot:COSAG01_NODE_7349_length_3241_cov_27.885742_5_plen_261_part_00
MAAWLPGWCWSRGRTLLCWCCWLPLPSLLGPGLSVVGSGAMPHTRRRRAVAGENSERRQEQEQQQQQQPSPKKTRRRSARWQEGQGHRSDPQTKGGRQKVPPKRAAAPCKARSTSSEHAGRGRARGVRALGGNELLTLHRRCSAAFPPDMARLLDPALPGGEERREELYALFDDTMGQAIRYAWAVPDERALRVMCAIGACVAASTPHTSCDMRLNWAWRAPVPCACKRTRWRGGRFARARRQADGGGRLRQRVLGSAAA